MLSPVTVCCCTSEPLQNGLRSAKNFFRVVFRSGGQLQTHCFQASDAFNKQQWLNCIRQAKEAVWSAESGAAQTAWTLCSGALTPAGGAGVLCYDGARWVALLRSVHSHTLWACTCVCVYVWCDALAAADSNPTPPARRIRGRSCLQLVNKAAMERRGGKFSDKEKDNPAAPSWSQNGALEEEEDCPDGPDEERRVKSVSWAAKPAQEQPRLNFHIPRKSREKRALFQSVSTDSREFSDVLQILSSSYKDSSSTGTFVYSKPRLVHSEPLEKDFMEKRRELKQDGRTEKELSETFCFLLCDAQKVSVVCERGLSVGSCWISMLGNPSKGEITFTTDTDFITLILEFWSVIFCKESQEIK
ncbi:uncharacterized protein [Sinocyclocheilus grahami]|uniref:uncharacterized protein n=1 Tax=Sinocyclocheilus grahami TaxID=75366 RepID=UPI0007AC751B|nr:PREDICTED: uncharacterized protein LOC107569244 [Sinocyclocheilus grahami]